MEEYNFNDFENAMIPEGKQEDGPDGSIYITDAEGNEYEIPKFWHYKNCFKFENEDLEEIV